MTVLFAQLVGVSVPREGRDPEDVKQVVGNALAGPSPRSRGLEVPLRLSRVRVWRPFSALPKLTKTTPNEPSGLGSG